MQASSNAAPDAPDEASRTPSSFRFRHPKPAAEAEGDALANFLDFSTPDEYEPGMYSHNLDDPDEYWDPNDPKWTEGDEEGEFQVDFDDDGNATVYQVEIDEKGVEALHQLEPWQLTDFEKEMSQKKPNSTTQS